LALLELIIRNLNLLSTISQIEWNLKYYTTHSSIIYFFVWQHLVAFFSNTIYGPATSHKKKQTIFVPEPELPAYFYTASWNKKMKYGPARARPRGINYSKLHQVMRLYPNFTRASTQRATTGGRALSVCQPAQSREHFTNLSFLCASAFSSIVSPLLRGAQCTWWCWRKGVECTANSALRQRVTSPARVCVCAAEGGGNGKMQLMMLIKKRHPRVFIRGSNRLRRRSRNMLLCGGG